MRQGLVSLRRSDSLAGGRKLVTVRDAARFSALPALRSAYGQPQIRLVQHLRRSDLTTNGGELRTLRDAASCITKLPKAEHGAPEWRTAIEVLMLVAERGGSTMLARIGVMRRCTDMLSVCSIRTKGASLGQAEAGAGSIISAHACPLLLAQRTQSDMRHFRNVPICDNCT